MSLEQYNSLMSEMLNQWCALTKLRAEIERREERVCWEYKRFRHLACNCRNREEIKGKLTPQNKFEVIASRVIQCGVREEVRTRRNEMVGEVKYFRCWGIGHFKWECSNIKVEKERRRSEEAAHVVSPQKAQQEERLMHFLWRKAQKYSSTWGMPPRSAALEGKGWKMR